MATHQVSSVEQPSVEAPLTVEMRRRLLNLVELSNSELTTFTGLEVLPLTQLLQDCLLSILQHRRPDYFAHSQRVATVCYGMALQLDWSEKRVMTLTSAGLLHDLGTVVKPNCEPFWDLTGSDSEPGIRNLSVDLLQACHVDSDLLEMLSLSQNFRYRTHVTEETPPHVAEGAACLSFANLLDCVRHMPSAASRRIDDILPALRTIAEEPAETRALDALEAWLSQPVEGFEEAAAQLWVPSDAVQDAETAKVVEEIFLGILQTLDDIERGFDGFFLLDATGRFQLWSSGCERLLGRPVREMRNKHWTNQVMGYCNQEGLGFSDSHTPLFQTLENGRPAQTTLCLQDVEERIFEVNVQTAPLFSEERLLQGIVELHRQTRPSPHAAEEAMFTPGWVAELSAELIQIRREEEGGEEPTYALDEYVCGLEDQLDLRQETVPEPPPVAVEEPVAAEEPAEAETPDESPAEDAEALAGADIVAADEPVEFDPAVGGPEPTATSQKDYYEDLENLLTRFDQLVDEPEEGAAEAPAEDAAEATAEPAAESIEEGESDSAALDEEAAVSELAPEADVEDRIEDTLAAAEQTLEESVADELAPEAELAPSDEVEAAEELAEAAAEATVADEITEETEDAVAELAEATADEARLDAASSDEPTPDEPTADEPAVAEMAEDVTETPEAPVEFAAAATEETPVEAATEPEELMLEAAEGGEPPVEAEAADEELLLAEPTEEVADEPVAEEVADELPETVDAEPLEAVEEPAAELPEDDAVLETVESYEETADEAPVEEVAAELDAALETEPLADETVAEESAEAPLDLAEEPIAEAADDAAMIEPAAETEAAVDDQAADEELLESAEPVLEEVPEPEAVEDEWESLPVPAEPVDVADESAAEPEAEAETSDEVAELEEEEPVLFDVVEPVDVESVDEVAAADESAVIEAAADAGVDELEAEAAEDVAAEIEPEADDEELIPAAETAEESPEAGADDAAEVVAEEAEVADGVLDDETSEPEDRTDSSVLVDTDELFDNQELSTGPGSSMTLEEIAQLPESEDDSDARFDTDHVLDDEQGDEASAEIGVSAVDSRMMEESAVDRADAEDSAPAEPDLAAEDSGIAEVVEVPVAAAPEPTMPESFVSHRDWDQYLSHLAGQYEDDKTPFSVIFVGLDATDRLHDLFSREFVNEVVEDVTRVLAEDCSEEELVCRYGSEQFAVALPKMTLSEADRRADLLRKRVAKAQIKRASGLDVTVSCGVSTMEEGDLTKRLLDRSEQALLIALKRGRNSTISVTSDSLRQYLSQQQAATKKTAGDEEQTFVFEADFEALVASDMIVYKLGGFLYDTSAKLVHVDRRHVAIRLGSKGLLPYWGRKDDARPVTIDLALGDDWDRAKTTKGALAPTTIHVTIKPVGWVRDPQVFQSRAARVLRELKSYFAAQ